MLREFEQLSCKTAKLLRTRAAIARCWRSLEEAVPGDGLPATGPRRGSTPTARGGRPVDREEWPGKASRRSGITSATPLVRAAGFATASPRGGGIVETEMRRPLRRTYA